MDHQFQFDKNRKRAELCPCGKSNRDGKFSPFQGFTDKGHCHSCGQNFYPDKENEFNPLSFKQSPKPNPNKDKPISYIDYNIFRRSQAYFDSNNFVTYLKTVFKADLVHKAIDMYKIGTSKLWNGATVFWQIDELGNARTGKIMLYDDHTGKRVKKPFDHINWVHSVIKIDDYNLGQVFFGTHCINSSSGSVAIVESEKTAIIASICFPNYTWLAAGCKDGLKIDKFNPIKNRHIILYPDADAYELWTSFAEKYKGSLKIKVSSLIDHSLSITEKDKGDDIADFLLLQLPDDLKPIVNQNVECDSNSIPDCASNMGKLINQNPNLSTLISTLTLVPDPSPSTNDNWQNDIPATILKIEQDITPNTSYHIDELKSLIKKHHSTLSIDFDMMVQQLVSNKVITQNTINHLHYYKYGSTPF